MAKISLSFDNFIKDSTKPKINKKGRMTFIKLGIINNFDVVDGHHVYHSKADQRVMYDIVQEAVRRAEEVIDIKFSGKY